MSRSIELTEREFAVARVELLETWRRLEVARDRFIRSVEADGSLPAWCEGITGDRQARAAAARAYADFFYEGQESPRSVHRLVGLVGASRRTVREAHSLNEQKRGFAESMGRLQHCVWIDEREGRHPLVRSAFQQIKIARINTLQVTRQVVLVERGLQKVSWCISRKNRMKRVTREEGISYIRSSVERQMRLSRDLAKLERLPPNTPLARFRPGDKIAIANATYLNKWGSAINRQYSSGMPLLIELREGEPLPPCREPNREPSARKPRPRLLESDYFVKSLKLRRYLQDPVKKGEGVNKRALSQLFRGP